MHRGEVPEGEVGKSSSGCPNGLKSTLAVPSPCGRQGQVALPWGWVALPGTGEAGSSH